MKAIVKAYFFDPVQRERVYCILLQLFLLLYIPLLSKLANIVLGGLIVFWLTEPNLWRKITRAFRNRLFLSVVLLYIIHVISLLYSTDLFEGIKRLETRLGLFAFPLIMGTIVLTPRTVQTILKTFIWGCALVGAVGLINSIFLFTQTGESVYLYSDNLLILTSGQAIYFALYLNVAILFIIFLCVTADLRQPERRALLFLVLPFFTVMIFLLAGRISLAILALLVVIVLIILIVKRKMYRLGFGMIAVGVVVGMLMASYFPKTINRFKALTNLEFDYSAPAEVYHFNDEAYQNKWNGLTIRLALWSCTWELIKQRPLWGTGIGDFMSELRQKYKEKDFKLGVARSFNPHNQYLQVWLALGVFGLLSLFIFLIYPAVHAGRQRNYLYLFFLLIVSVNMLTEDVFAVYRGVVFFSLLNSLLLFHPARYPRDKS